MKTDVLIIVPDVQDYLPLLAALEQQGVQLTAARTAAEAKAAYAGQAIVLGQPDLVADALPDMPGVKWVQSTWAGVTPLLDTGRRDFLLTGVKGVFGPQMAEYVFGTLLARELRLEERRAYQRRHEWWDAPSGTLDGKTLGVMGTGSIGRHIAGVAPGFGMRAVGFSRSGAGVEGFERVYSREGLHAFLAEADYVVSVLPDTPATTGLLDADAFRAMQSTACLVNVGRGSVVDEDALVAALEAGELAGAVLDVFREEPLPADHPLWDAPGVLITAHMAARSMPQDIARIFVENYRRYVNGGELLYRIDFERGY